MYKIVNPKNVPFKIWERMTKGEIRHHPSLRPTIKSSWERCKTYSIDPYNPEIKVDGNINHTRAENKVLIENAKPFMRHINNFVSGSGFVVILCDCKGIIIELLGDNEVMEDAENIMLAIGTDWSEAYMGTSAIGTCLALQDPIQICGTEHYLYNCHKWTCSAAPVYGLNDEVIGVLNMSGDRRLVHQHTLGMVVAASEAITSNLKNLDAWNRINLTNEFLTQLMESMTEGIISLDKDLRIQHFNKTAKKMLKLKRIDIGQEIPTLLKEAFGLKKGFNGGYSYTDKEIFIGSPYQKTLSATLRIITNEKFISGAVITFREIKSVKKMVNNMIGARAHFDFQQIIGKSGSIKKTIDLAKNASNVNANVLLTGESGTGKELFAQSIHNNSDRKCEPFIAINCAAVPRELIGSELFGYTEGAFTGAKRTGAAGKFELADGGTIFLDEIADMPLEQQATLLRTLEERHVYRIGSSKAIPVDVKIISATNKNLIEEVNNRKFREDLFYRLNVICIHIPPLRDRPDDILLYAFHFLDVFNKEFGFGASFSSETKKLLTKYTWPGNVRELQNSIQHSMFMSNGGIISPEHLNIETNYVSNNETKDTSLDLNKIETDSINKALDICNGKVEDAARILGIGRATLYRKLKRKSGEVQGHPIDTT